MSPSHPVKTPLSSGNSTTKGQNVLCLFSHGPTACHSQIVFCTHPVLSYSPLTHLFVLCLPCIYCVYNQKPNLNFQGGVCE